MTTRRSFFKQAGLGLAAAAGYRVACYDPFFSPDQRCLEEKWPAIMAIEVVEHFHEPAREFGRLAGLLEPGGVLVLMTALFEAGRNFSGWHYVTDPTHVTFYSRSCLEWVAGHWGLELVSCSDRLAVFGRQASAAKS